MARRRGGRVDDRHREKEVWLEPELALLLLEHKLASNWTQPNDLVFPGRARGKPRDRNSLLHAAVERA